MIGGLIKLLKKLNLRNTQTFTQKHGIGMILYFNWCVGMNKKTTGFVQFQL